MIREQAGLSTTGSAFGDLSRKWALIAVPIGSLAFLIFARGGHFEQGLAAYFSITILVTLAKICWPLRNRWWVWLILSIFAVIHICAVVMVPPFELHSPAVVLVPFGILDFLLWFAILWYAQRRLD